MNDFIGFALCFGFFVLLLLIPFIWLMVRAFSAKEHIEKLEARLKLLEVKLQQQPPYVAPNANQTLSRMERLHDEALEEDRLHTKVHSAVRVAEVEAKQVVAAKAFEEALIAPPPIYTRLHAESPALKVVAPTPTTPMIAPPAINKVTQEELHVPAINWEKFLGVNLFAWVGGLALFLGAVFFIKYSFDNNLISPQMRIAMGYVLGVGLIVGGLKLSREKLAVTVQTLCATGTVILYANTFAAHSYYHFIEQIPTFAIMALITAAAFILAVRLDARFVAVLGLLGGFLTPLVLSTGVDNPVGLFGYLAILNMGLIAVALRKRWGFLVLLGACATVFMQIGWMEAFFIENKIAVAMAIFGGFAFLFVAALAIADRLNRVESWISAAAIVMPSVALLFALYLTGDFYRYKPNHDWIANPATLFGFIFFMDTGFLLVAWLRAECRAVLVWAGGFVFLILGLWTLNWLQAPALNIALGAYLLFSALHSTYPIVLQRLKPAATSLAAVHLFPVLALLFVMLPIVKNTELSWMLWPVVLLIDILGIMLAVFTASLLAIFAVLVLTVFATGIWITQTPISHVDLNGELLVIGAFAVFFLLAILWAGKKVFSGQVGSHRAAALNGKSAALSPEMFNQLASVSAILPFLLLVMVTQQMKLTNPSSVFGLSALLAVLLLAVVRLCKIDFLALISLGCVLLVEYAWHTRWFEAANYELAAAWYLSFGLLFLAFPFVFIKKNVERSETWIASALSLPLHFFLIYRAVHAGWAGFGYFGLVPAALAVPSLLGLVTVIRSVPSTAAIRNTLLALMGATTLFFVTFIFPIQFERQWLTVGWALEGAALLWLFTRVPHGGLRLAGFLLLVVCFARLSLNPWVITEYGRSGTPIFNWYLYTYGLVTVCLLAGGYLLAPPRQLISELNARSTLYGLGAVLAFILLNIEIADYFSAPGPQLTLDFNSTFAQDMAYSLGWAAYSFVLLTIGFNRKTAAMRYAGMGLMVVTIIKLFLHDLWQLGGLYRIGSLVGLAVVLMLISFIYQRFLAKPTEIPARNE